MRNSRHLKIITSHVENLEDFKSQLETIQTNVLTVIEKAELWIKEKENDFSFLEMSQFLTNETSKFIIKCHTIASDNNESARGISTSGMAVETLLSGSCKSNRADEKEFEMLKERLEKIETTLSTHSRKFKTVNQKLKALENYNETNNSQKEQNDWIMQELNSASEFMTQIQSENELLTERITSYENSMSNLNAASESWKLKQKCLEEQIEQLQNTIQINEKSNRMKVEELGKEVHDTNLTLNSSNKKFVALKDSITDLATKVGDVSSEMQTLCNKVEEIENVTAPKVYQLKDRNLAQSSNTATDKSLDLCHLQDALSEVVLVMENNKDYPSMHVIFSAHVDVKTDEWNFEEHGIVNCFTAVAYNEGGYAPKTGIFTASCNGIYKCRVTVSTRTDQLIQLGLFKMEFKNLYDWVRKKGVEDMQREQLRFKRERKSEIHQKGNPFVQNADIGKDFIYRDNNDILVATSLDQAEITDRTSRILCYVQLNQRDTLYVKSFTNCQNLRLHSFSQFTCSLLAEV